MDWDEVIARHREQHQDPAQIARALGFSPATIRQGLVERGAYRRRPLLSPALLKRRQRLYMIWHRMHKRCRDSSDHQYPNFGGKGVELCAAWDDFETFLGWAATSGYRLDRTIVLDDITKGFTPKNCRWVTTRTAQALMRRHCDPPPALHPITAFGETRAKEAWLRDPRCVVSAGGLSKRLANGYPPEIAITYSPEQLKAIPKPRKPRAARRLQIAKRREPDWPEAARLRRRGWSSDRIARKLGFSAARIRGGLLERGVKAPPPERRMARPHWRLVYKKWIMLRNRCNNPEFKNYKYYGGKGVKICREWRRFEKFYQWAMARGFRPGLCLSRIHKKRAYSPANCAWVTRSHASRHASRPLKVTRKPRWTLDAFGETKGIAAWTRDPRCHIAVPTLLRRLRQGIPPEEAISAPPAHPGKGGEVFIDAFGERMYLAEWSRDRRCKVSVSVLRDRILRGVRAEEAITAPPYRSPTLLNAPPGKQRRRRSRSRH
ncbi:MAG: hypothetical protein L0Z55_08635 [Planctomycetes bacterium]|nr:hypothetical protein [Planctomycetota bacterium]